MEVSFNDKQQRNGESLPVLSNDTGVAEIERQAYIFEHAPRVLAALIMRRVSTNPEELIATAVDATAKLFDQIRPHKKLV